MFRAASVPQFVCLLLTHWLQSASHPEFKLFDNGLRLDISSYPHMNIRMSTKGKRPLRSLTPSDKVHAIQRIHDGESKASVARDIGVPESTLRGWCKNEDKLRYMSRQSASEKMGAEGLTDKIDVGANLLVGPPEKRQRLDTSMPLNFSNKIKFEEMNTFKRSPLTGLDFGGNKPLTDIASFNNLAPDYAPFNGAAKNKIFGADISRTTDPSITAISPLSSLSHLSGLTGVSQSPLAISFSELTSNLNLLAQLNPSLAAMSGLNGLAAGTNNLRNNSMKPKQQAQSPRNENTERQTGLTVKNWAKQKPPTPTTTESSSFGVNLSQNESKSQLKTSSTTLIPPQLGANLPTLPTLPEDPLLYWLKSQQAMLGLNSLYPPPPPPIDASSPPIRSSTPQQQQQSVQASSPPIIPTPLTPSSTPSGSLDDKNSAWFNWCKAFGASLNSLAPAAAAVALHSNSLHHPPASVSGVETANPIEGQIANKTGPENILYSQLTKDSAPSPSVQSSSSVEQVNAEVDLSNKPEDLSAKAAKVKSPPMSPLPTPVQSPEHAVEQIDSIHNSPVPSPAPVISEGDLLGSETLTDTRNSVADCRDVLDNLLYKINNNNKTSNCNRLISSTVSESEASYNSDHNTDDSSHNNNNNSNKTDEEERAKYAALNGDEIADAEYQEAIKYGEKFLKWLENCSNPRVTAVQLMQLRFLITSIKTAADPKVPMKDSISTFNLSTAIEIDDSSEESNRSKSRRRK